MGTRFEVVLPAPAGAGPSAEAALRAAGEAAIDEIETWHRRLTRFEPDSLVSHIVRTAAETPVRLDVETFALFRDAVQVWQASGGAFDITRPGAPDGRGAGEAIALDPGSRTIAFTRPGVTIDLGGIGKGHAVDLAASRLREAGVSTAFVHGGTSSALALGRPPGLAGWPVALADGPTGEVIDLAGRALSVSKRPRESFYEIRKKIPGVFSGAGAVVVLGPSARLADAWSTALAVLGRVPATFPAGYGVHWLRSAD